MEVEREIFVNAFPPFLASDINSCLDKLDLNTSIKSTRCFQVNLDGNTLYIPYRIYYSEPITTTLNETEAFLLDCIFTRHHNGYVREACLKRIIKSDDYVVTPFIAQLIGEYVTPILNIIRVNLTPAKLDNLIKLKAQNPEFFKTTEDRVQSYWNCKSRWAIPNKKDYVGFQILDEIRNRNLLG